jgi:hypothetical protein
LAVVQHRNCPNSCWRGKQINKTELSAATQKKARLQKRCVLCLKKSRWRDTVYCCWMCDVVLRTATTTYVNQVQCMFITQLAEDISKFN